jgi:hypothetical protein
MARHGGAKILDTVEKLDGHFLKSPTAVNTTVVYGPFLAQRRANSY